MCGIAGIAALDPKRPVDATPVANMLSCVRHRGPDDDGVFAAPGVVIGHRRLAVIDVEHGHQPLLGQRATTHTVVNGEIYNYRELARELERLGSRFRTASDSEIVAHAYDVWGLDALDRFDGMFALAIWDEAERTLLLARDRMGEKPLFWTVADGLLVFGSELSALLAHPAVQPAIDAAALSEYLALDYVPAPRCLVRGVNKLEPGTALVLAGGSVRTHRYWSIDPLPAASPERYDVSVRTLRRLLDDAVATRLVSDVPLGVFLSGGLDSSTVAALAARHGALDTFSIGFDEASFDESAHARAVAAHIGSRHHERVVRGTEMPELVPALGSMLDEPIGDASILPTWVLSSFAREHVTVALGGDGGDELFAGYPMHQAHRLAGAVRAMPAPALAAAQWSAARLPVSHANFAFGFKATTFLRGAAHPPPVNHGMWLASFTPADLSTLLLPELRAAAGTHDPFTALHDAWAASDGAPLLARATHLDATTYLPNDILTKVDRASMAVSLEVRAPLLARSIVEFAFDLPDAYRMRGLTGKRILRDAARELLPAVIIDRPKKGFGMPVAAWLNGPLAPLVDDMLGEDAIRAGGLFDPAAVRRMLDQHRRRERDLRKPLWTLLVFELWRTAHIPPVRGRP